MWTDELTGAVEQENFLLDKGRLKLKTVRQAFNASLVRISIGRWKRKMGHFQFCTNIFSPLKDNPPFFYF